jgi:hypothetical protein
MRKRHLPEIHSSTSLALDVSLVKFRPSKTLAARASVSSAPSCSYPHTLGGAQIEKFLSLREGR